MHPITKWILRLYIAFYRRILIVYEKLSVGSQLGYWESHRQALLHAGANGYRCSIDELKLQPHLLATLKQKHPTSHDPVIAEIDQDGFFFSHIGPINGLPTIEKESFVRRKRFRLQIVSIDKFAGVKKHFDNDKSAFLREIKALHLLGKAGCNVPELLDVDFQNLTLTFSYIRGDVLREKLAEKGAIVRDRDVADNPRFKSMTPLDAWHERIKEGRRVLHETVDSAFVEALFSQLTKIHGAGFVLDDIKYGNIIIEKESGYPYIIDFDHARSYPGISKLAFSLLCDRDIEKFNLHFGTNKRRGG